MKKMLVLSLVSLSLAACDSGMSGKYANNVVAYHFHSDGTVDRSATGAALESSRPLDMARPAS